MQHIAMAPAGGHTILLVFVDARGLILFFAYAIIISIPNKLTRNPSGAIMSDPRLTQVQKS